MATAADVLDLARDTMLGFGLGFLPEDTELLRRLFREERSLIEELLRLDNMALVMPGDATATVDVSSYVVSYAKPATLWRVRQAALDYTTGPSRTIKTVPANWRHTIPAFQPSMYFAGANFFPIDNGTTRIYGWTAADDVVFDFVTEPVALTAGTDTLNAPDEAVPYLGNYLAHFMAVRGKVAQLTLNEIKAHSEREKARLLALAKSQPGADQYPPGS